MKGGENMELLFLFLLCYCALGILTVNYIPRQIEKRLQEILVVKSTLIIQIKYAKELEISNEERDRKIKHKDEILEEITEYKSLLKDLESSKTVFKIFAFWFVYLPKTLGIKH